MKIFFSELYFELKKNRGAMIGIIIIILSLIIALLAPLIAPHNPTEVFADALRLPPSFTLWIANFAFCWLQCGSSLTDLWYILRSDRWILRWDD